MITPQTRSDIEASFDRTTLEFHAFWQVTIKLTDGCTLGCAYCSQHVDAPHRTEFDFDAFRALVKAAKEERLLQSILLTGGEPLLYSQFASTLRLLTAAAITFDVNTALFVGRERLDALVEHPPRTLRFSLQGTESDRANVFYQRPAWDTVVGNARYLLDRLDSRSVVHVNLGVTRHSYRHLPRDIGWITSTFGPSEILLNPTISHEALQLRATEVRDYYDNILPRMLDIPQFASMQHAPWRAKILFGPRPSEPSSSVVSGYVTHVASCHAGYSSLYVDNFLNVYPCITHQVHRSWPAARCLGTLPELDFLRRLRRTRTEPCLDPRENAVCAAVCPNYFGAVNQVIAGMERADAQRAL